jgi:hypothetical protein
VGGGGLKFFLDLEASNLMMAATVTSVIGYLIFLLILFFYVSSFAEFEIENFMFTAVYTYLLSKQPISLLFLSKNGSCSNQFCRPSLCEEDKSLRHIFCNMKAFLHSA